LLIASIFSIIFFALINISCTFGLLVQSFCYCFHVPISYPFVRKYARMYPRLWVKVENTTTRPRSGAYSKLYFSGTATLPPIYNPSTDAKPQNRLEVYCTYFTMYRSLGLDSLNSLSKIDTPSTGSFHETRWLASQFPGHAGSSCIVLLRSSVLRSRPRFPSFVRC
jgi:hypothetical protein